MAIYTTTQLECHRQCYRLRTDNEALRERVKELEKVIEKCERSLNMWEHASTNNGLSSPEWFKRRVAEKNAALAAIQAWRDKK